MKSRQLPVDGSVDVFHFKEIQQRKRTHLKQREREEEMEKSLATLYIHSKTLQLCLSLV